MNRLPKMREQILAGLAQATAVRVNCARPRRFARVLQKELRMCDVKIESETPGDTRGMNRVPPQGVLVITWKTVP